MAAGGAAWYAASRQQREAALVNYSAVLGLAPHDPQVARIARRAFSNYGRMLADFVLLGSLRPHELLESVTIDGREHLDAALELGHGCIMAVPHMGSWDVGGSYAGVLGYRIAAVAERFPKSLDEAVRATRSRFGLRVIPLARAAVRAIGEALAANSIVALLCDLPQGPGVEVQFFGMRALVPAGPAALAARHAAPVMPACVWRTGPGRYHVHLDPWLEAPTMQAIVQRFEGFIRRRPDQWYAFRPLFS